MQAHRVRVSQNGRRNGEPLSAFAFAIAVRTVTALAARGIVGLGTGQRFRIGRIRILQIFCARWSAPAAERIKKYASSDEHDEKKDEDAREGRLGKSGGLLAVLGRRHRPRISNSPRRNCILSIT